MMEILANDNQLELKMLFVLLMARQINFYLSILVKSEKFTLFSIDKILIC